MDNQQISALKALARELIEIWQAGTGIDGFDLQDLLEKHGAIEEQEGGATPEDCETDFGADVALKPGDTIYKPVPWLQEG